MVQLNFLTSITLYSIFLMFTLIRERKLDLIIYDLSHPSVFISLLLIAIWSYYCISSSDSRLIMNHHDKIGDSTHVKRITIKSLMAFTIAYFARLDLYIPCFWLYWIITYYFPESGLL